MELGRVVKVKEVSLMRKIFGLAVLLAMVAVLLVAVVPALAESPFDKIDCSVQPVIGGPDSPQLHSTNATVNIPDSNPAIRDALLPGNVFVPLDLPD